MFMRISKVLNGSCVYITYITSEYYSTTSEVVMYQETSLYESHCLSFLQKGCKFQVKALIWLYKEWHVILVFSIMQSRQTNEDY